MFCAMGSMVFRASLQCVLCNCRMCFVTLLDVVCVICWCVLCDVFKCVYSGFKHVVCHFEICFLIF
jgi:hypothetical protein